MRSSFDCSSFGLTTRMLRAKEDLRMKCRDCENTAEINKTLCSVCLLKARERTNKRRSRLVSSGLCSGCGLAPFVVGKELCVACFVKKQTANQARQEKYKKQNRCTKCGRSKNYVDSWKHSWCVGCQLKFKFGYSVSFEAAELLINSLLAQQNYRCALTGRDLRANKYHIDHIVPRSIDRSRVSDPANWQLIVEDANMFKEGCSVETVIFIARDIVKEAIRKGILSAGDLITQ